MTTARIVVLAIAVGAGGIGAHPASGSDNKPASAEVTLRSITDLNASESRSYDQPSRRGESINVVRYGVASLTTTQK